jgi:hypothetical protein
VSPKVACECEVVPEVPAIAVAPVPPGELNGICTVAYFLDTFRDYKFYMSYKETQAVLISLMRRILKFDFCLPPAYLVVLVEIISSTLKMEAICFSETSVVTQETTRLYVPEEDTLH